MFEGLECIPILHNPDNWQHFVIFMIMYEVLIKKLTKKIISDDISIQSLDNQFLYF